MDSKDDSASPRSVPLVVWPIVDGNNNQWCATRSGGLRWTFIITPSSAKIPLPQPKSPSQVVPLGDMEEI